MREDYDINKLFSYGLATFFAMIIGVGVGIWAGNYWFWLAMIAYAVMAIILIRKFHFRPIEIIEGSTPGFLFINLLLLLHGLSRGGTATVVLFLFTVFLLILFFILKANYKRFTWYKSGRLGFASLITLGLLFLARAITSVTAPQVISHVGVLEFIPSAIISFFSFFTVYNLNND